MLNKPGTTFLINTNKRFLNHEALNAKTTSLIQHFDEIGLHDEHALATWDLVNFLLLPLIRIITLYRNEAVTVNDNFMI